MKICGIDPSTHLGWAVGEPGKRPRWGLYEVPDYGGDDGRRMTAVIDWFAKLHREELIEWVFWELPVIYPNRIEINSLYTQISITNAIQIACTELEIRNRYVVVNSWRKRFIGITRGPTEVLKQQAKLACAARGWLIDDHNIAEAVGIWEYGCSLADPAYAWGAKATIRREEAKREILYDGRPGTKARAKAFARRW